MPSPRVIAHGAGLDELALFVVPIALWWAFVTIRERVRARRTRDEPFDEPLGPEEPLGPDGGPASERDEG